MAPLCHFPSETSRDCATCCWGGGSARDWRWREGSSGNLLLDSPPFSSPSALQLLRPTQTDRQAVRLSEATAPPPQGKQTLTCRRSGCKKVSRSRTTRSGAARGDGERQVLPCAVSGQRAASVRLSAYPSSEVGEL